MLCSKSIIKPLRIAKYMHTYIIQCCPFIEIFCINADKFTLVSQFNVVKSG
jgi:hypothetical protein